MARAVALLTLTTLMACNGHVEIPGSNVPDGGACPAPSGPGSATLQGPRAFTVAGATEHLARWVSNLPDGGSSAAPSNLELRLSEQVLACGAAPTLPDGGLADAGTWSGGDLLLFSLSARSGVFSPGDFVVGGAADAGSAWGLVLAKDHDAGMAVYAVASGKVRLTDVQPCSVAGSFDVVLGAADGGSDSPLSGSFAPVYCPR